MSQSPAANYDLIVIGGGAAGFFGAINAAENKRGLRVLILEKSSKLLSKVRVSGGGRCNVTHHCFEYTPLSKHYPRGQRPLKNLFQQFQAKDTVAWFEQRGVKLKTEEDGRMFPTTDSSQTIIDCFMREAEKLGIEIRTNSEVLSLEKVNDEFIVHTLHAQIAAKKVLIAAGGYNKPENYKWLASLGHQIVQPIPSLFTFNDSAKEFTEFDGCGCAGSRSENCQHKIFATRPGAHHTLGIQRPGCN
jgi:predicted Rossmann fold flavoprotein